MNELYSKSGLLIRGIGQLDAGSKKLNDGMSQFYKEGIGKIVSLYNDKLKGTVNNAESLVAAGKAYNTFTQVPDGMDGTVKFIYRTKVAVTDLHKREIYQIYHTYICRRACGSGPRLLP